MKIQQFKAVRQPLTPEQQDQKLQEVAKLYEKQFLREMMKQMRATVPEGGGFIPTSNAEKIFREQLDQEYVENWGERGGVGLADMVHKQLLEKFGPMLGIRPKMEVPTGPIKIDEKSQLTNPLKVQTAQAGGTRPMKTTMQYDLQKAALADHNVTAPWAGTLLGVKKIGADEHLLEMSHDNGLKSQMVFRGQMATELQPSKLQAGTEIQAGQRLGLLSPEAKSFFWTVDVTDSL
jgi:peptidoglycan hydrolase FlgJ